MPSLPPRPVGITLAVVVTLVALPVQGFSHGWDTVGDMLGANFHAAFDGRYTPKPDAHKDWEWIANHYAVVALGRFEDFNPPGGYNCTTESSRTLVARLLKKINPGIKLLWYQNEVSDFTCACCNQLLRQRPEWWWRDDEGLPVVFGDLADCLPAVTKNCRPYIDFGVPAARDWYMRQPLREVLRGDSEALVDGLFVDGTMYYNPEPGNISKALYKRRFLAKMTMLRAAQDLYHGLNGGEVWGNPLLEFQEVGVVNPSVQPVLGYNATLQYYGGAFDEMFGSFVTNDCGYNHGCTAEWSVPAMMESIFAARNATMIDKKTLVIHSFPGPAGTPIGPVNGSGPPGFPVIAAGWDGPQPAPWQAMKSPEYRPIDVVNAMKRASADRLVESLAPFLIVAEETSFFGYAWFYDIESGYAPCDDNRTMCLAADGWYPEFSRHLGPPHGPATQSGVNGTIWTRDFDGASVFIDLANRSASRITWHS